MEMDKKTVITIGVILFLFTCWSLGNMMVIMENYEGGGTNLVPSEGPLLTPLAISAIFISFTVFLFLYILLTDKNLFKISSIVVGMHVFWGLGWYAMMNYGAIIFVIMFIVGGLALIFVENSEYWAKIYFTSALIIFIIYGIPSLFLSQLRDTIRFIPGGGTGGNGGGGTSEGLIENIMLITGENIGIILMILLSLTIVSILIVQKVKEREVKETDSKEIEKDMSTVADRAISELIEGKDVRSTILRCYQQMCDLLEDKGIDNTEYITPREFKLITLKNLNISEEVVSDLTNLFEEARYSSHKLGDEDRRTALQDIRNLRKELSISEQR